MTLPVMLHTWSLRPVARQTPRTRAGKGGGEDRGDGRRPWHSHPHLSRIELHLAGSADIARVLNTAQTYRRVH